jgi:EAL domain-containing protein (putative c-di-GMP-specific phosphodiesterase class I)
LTSNQAADADLVGHLRAILADTGLPAARLRLGFPVAALLPGRGEALDNVAVLSDVGVAIMVTEVAGAGELASLEDLPIAAVRVASSLVTRQAERAGKGSLVDRALTDLVTVAHLASAEVVVDGVHTERQARWWREARADTGCGGLFAPHPGSPHDLGLDLTR